MSTFSIIITAGGIGKRMGAKLPKQFMLIKERPLLMYTIEQFYNFDLKAQIILTLPSEWRAYWEKLIYENDFKIPHRIIEGGAERYHSVKNALELCRGDYIMVHDGVRPLVDSQTIKTCAIAVKSKKAVVTVIPVNESMRKITGESSKAVNRSEYRTVQTPQCFERELLVKAYEQKFHKGITDDAGLVEESGVKIHTVQGNFENIKITTKTDLLFAEQLLK
jgi:2-C-methyl-D-erythritol 4-phosphate cytidylyltransferase